MPRLRIRDVTLAFPCARAGGNIKATWTAATQAFVTGAAEIEAAG